MGTIIGSMIFVGLGKTFSIIQLESSVTLSFLVQVSLGIMIGLSFTKLTKNQLQEIKNSILFIVISVMMMTVVTGLIVSYITSVPLSVSILSSAPGGMVEMATMAEGLGLEAPSVIFLHFLRLLIVMLIYPSVIKYISRLLFPVGEVKDNIITSGEKEANMKESDRRSTFYFRKGLKVFFLIAVALLGGLIGYLTNFPIGALIGSLLAVAILNFVTNKYPILPLIIKRCIQIFIGANIGLSFTNETFLVLPKLILPGLLITLLTIIFSLILAYLLTRLLQVDRLTAVCGLAPAGMSEMVIIAENYQVNISTVVTMHLFRIITIITCIPVIVYQLL